MKLHTFVAMPFGKKTRPDGSIIDFDAIYNDLLKPAIEDAGLEVSRADEELAAGDIRTDMFQELLIADLVLVDLTLDNPNVWYELGVRDALRARGVVLVQGSRDTQPFDKYTDRKYIYSLKNGLPNSETLDNDKAAITKIVKATIASWHGRKISPVFNLLPNLEEPEWKRLKIGAARKFWEAHDKWSERIDLARKEQHIGDIMLLAEEAPVAAFRSNAYCWAAKSFFSLEHFRLALEYFDKCLEVEPDHLEALQKKGICLQRLGEHHQASAHYKKLLEKNPHDAEIQGLLGRVEKDAWVKSWRLPDSSQQQMREDAKEESEFLCKAIDSYHNAFKDKPNHYYTGINALTLMHLFYDLTQDARYKTDATSCLSGAISWAACCEANDQEKFWAKATIGDLEILTGTANSVTAAYKKAVVYADGNWFALNSTLQQLRLLDDLGFRPECVKAGINVFERTLEKLNKPKVQWQPRQVILFSGHMVDAPDRPTPRFPLDKVPIAEAAMAKALDELGAGSDDLALTQGASGGDLIFAEACQARGVKLQLMQPFPEPEFIERSVAPAAGAWRSRFYAVKAKLTQATLCMPTELGMADRNPFERCNLWLLYTALAYGPEKVKFVCLWNGGGGDAPGGSAQMVEEVKKRTGQVVWLDTRKLW